MSIAHFLADGGGFAYAAVLFGLFTVLVCLAHLLTAFVRTRFDLGGIVIGAIGATVAIGLAGLLMNLQAAFGAVSQAAPDQKAALLFESGAESLHALVIACAFGAIAAAISGVAATVRANRAPKEAAS